MSLCENSSNIHSMLVKRYLVSFKRDLKLAMYTSMHLSIHTQECTQAHANIHNAHAHAHAHAHAPPSSCSAGFFFSGGALGGFGCMNSFTVANDCKVILSGLSASPCVCVCVCVCVFVFVCVVAPVRIVRMLWIAFCVVFFCGRGIGYKARVCARAGIHACMRNALYVCGG
jgi:hypothetical protein